LDALADHLDIPAIETVAEEFDLRRCANATAIGAAILEARHRCFASRHVLSMPSLLPVRALTANRSDIVWHFGTSYS
jgi:hypothetical protein